MIKKILFWILGIVLTIFVIGGIYFWAFMYEPPLISEDDLATTNLMPLPAKMEIKNSFFTANEIDFQFNENCGDLVKNATYKKRLGWEISETGKTIEIEVQNLTTKNRKPVEDESYSLIVKPNIIEITAATEYGALWALETLFQLNENGEENIKIPTCIISDSPRYPWRGVMLDICRHWIPKEVILRVIEGMSSVKMNVLHLHLTEYQGFRIESKTFPKLHELGSGGDYLTQDEIKEIVSFATARGIRVVPEFDLPGHSTSWFVGYPELASAPGPYKLDTLFGVLNPVFDPTREEVYEFLDAFMAEVSELFPDEYIHIGGDEVHAHDWENNSEIQRFMVEQNLESADDLQAYFNKRMQPILKKHGKKMLGWDEILHPDLDTTVVVQSWRSQKSLWQAVKKEGKAILSAGWYLDHKLPAATHYKVDPEILPNAITIEPDSLNWKTFELEMNFNETILPMDLTFYGEGENQRGFISLMENLMGFENVIVNDNQRTFKVDSDYGMLTCNVFIEDEKLTGTFGLGLIKMDLIGELTGSNSIAGTFPPKVEKTEPLTEKEKNRILGGEACIWAEVVNAQNIESRIWPRTAAIAEKLWSPESLTKDTENMYRRLKIIDNYLIENGAEHKNNQLELVKNMVGESNIPVLMNLVDVLEEVKYYNRLSYYNPLTVNTPLNGLADAAMPESFVALEFNRLVDEYILDSEKQIQVTEIESMLTNWKNNHLEIIKLVKSGNPTESLESLSEKLKMAAEVGLEIIEKDKLNELISDAEKAEMNEILLYSAEPEAGAEIAVVNAIVKLLQ